MYFTSCKILGIKPGSDEETVKAAYRKLAKELHPDVNDSEKAHQSFILLQNAYMYLLQHPYNEKQIELLKRYQNSGHRKENRINNLGKARVTRELTRTYTLRDILKKSMLARIVYVSFHLLFISVGIYLIYRPVYDVFYRHIFENVSYISVYLAVGFAFLSGIIITSSFVVTGINFIRQH